MKTVGTILIWALSVSMVMSNCHFQPINRMKDKLGRYKSFCSYQDWKIGVNSAVQAPNPMCEACRCTKYGLTCCGYGKKGRVISVPSHCMMVSSRGSCEYAVVRKDNQLLEC